MDIIGGRTIVPLPKTPPRPRFDPEPAPPPEPSGKAAKFVWEVCRPGSPETIETKVGEFVLSEAEYQAARGKERLPTRPITEYVKYVRLGLSPSVRQVAEYFRDESVKEAYSPLDELMNIVCFARGIAYKADQETRGVGEYASFPIETLYDQAGDCEDHAILAAVLLHNLGHDVALFYLDL